MSNDYWLGILIGCFATFGFNLIANLILMHILVKMAEDEAMRQKQSKLKKI